MSNKTTILLIKFSFLKKYRMAEYKIIENKILIIQVLLKKIAKNKKIEHREILYLFLSFKKKQKNKLKQSPDKQSGHG